MKGYRKVEAYCLERSKSTHTELSEEEIQSLHLSPAYDRELYSIIQAARTARNSIDANRLSTYHSMSNTIPTANGISVSFNFLTLHLSTHSNFQ